MSREELCERLGTHIDPSLLRTALTHRSFAYENGEEHYERLEFLGDSIVGMIVAEKVFRDFPDSPEGDLSKMRTYVVSEAGLSDIARELHVGDYLRLGRGEVLHGGRDKDSILCDAMESIIAAIYLTNGIDETRRIVEKLVEEKIRDASVLGPNLDWQTSFEEVAHLQGMEGTMSFEIESSGPDHARIYTAHAYMAGRQWGSGRGTSQKKARHKAAQSSYWMLVKGEKTEVFSQSDQDTSVK